MRHLNISKLAATPMQSAPFQYVIVPGFLSAETVKAINATYPNIDKGGSYPIESLDAGMAIKDVIDELDSAEFEAAIAEKFDVELSGKPKMYSLRGYTRSKDGQIHTDSKDKIITVLLYLNEDWKQPGGRLRILRNGRDVDDYAAEVPPDNGTLVGLQAFRDLLARPPSLRWPAPLVADELDDIGRGQGLSCHSPQDIGDDQEVDGRVTPNPLPTIEALKFKAAALASALVAAAVFAAPASAQKFPSRVDGLYEFQAKPRTGTLSVKSVKGGLLFALTTVSPKGATCAASGMAIGGSVATFREKEAGFRLTIQRDQITISGLLGRVSETPFCGLNGMLTGVYKRRGPLDAEAAAILASIDEPAAAAPSRRRSRQCPTP